MIDISKLTPDQLDRYIHLQSIVARQQEDADRVKAARQYYDGEQPAPLTTRQAEFLGGHLTSGNFPFNHNLIKTVIDTLRERLSVTGFTVNGKSAGDTKDGAPDPEAQLAGMLWQWWKHNRMESQQIRVHRRGLRDGLTYVMVDYDNDKQRPRFSLHEVDDIEHGGVCLHRDQSDENVTMFATRYFTVFDPLKPGETGKQRKTVYLPGEIRKYVSLGAPVWAAIEDDGDNGWPIAWRDWISRPLGVAAVEFQNPGGSEVTALAGMQNALNKAWLDLMAAADASGFPVLVIDYKDPNAPGFKPNDDDDLSGSDEFEVAPGLALEVFGANTHRIEGGNLDHMIKVCWTIVEAIAGISATPSQFLKPFPGVDVPSGEALKQLESGLVARAKERQLVFGESWADVMGLAYRVARTFGRNIPQVDDPVIGVQWADPSTRMEKSEAEIAEILKRLGIPDDIVWERAGLTPEQIATARENLLKQRAQEIATIVAATRQTQTTQAGAQENQQTNPQVGVA